VVPAVLVARNQDRDAIGNGRTSFATVAMMQAFESGQVVKIPVLSGSGTKSEVTKKDSSSLGFDFIEGEVLVDPKSKKGYLVIEKRRYDVKLNWLPKMSGRGGR
jgi:hypothetical protein